MAAEPGRERVSVRQLIGLLPTVGRSLLPVSGRRQCYFSRDLSLEVDMRVWKRRLAFVLAVGTGTLGLTLSTAGAQTPPDFPPFPTFPTFPEFPTFPTTPPPTMPPPTSPPPTMPPPTMAPPTFPPFPTIPTVTTPPPTMPPPTTTPPPTMPPPTSTPPPTMPPTSVPSFEDLVSEAFEELLDDLEGLSEEGRELLEEIRDEFFS